MMDAASRRSFLAAGLGLPAAALATPSTPASTSAPAAQPAAPVQAGGLRYRTLGKTGIKVTELGFGCMITSDASVIARAVDLGINYVDTARSYQGGNNERMVGAAIKSKRNSLVLSSKFKGGPKADCLNNLETSLKELGTDHLDIWYLHAKSTPADISEEFLEAAETAKKQGKIRFAGISTHAGQPELVPAVIKNGRFDMLLTSYNFTMDPGMDAIIKSAKQAGMGVVAMKVMAGGFRRMKPGEKGYEAMKRPGGLLAALKWVLRNPDVDTTIPSMTDMEQLDENMKAMSSSFNDEDRKLLAQQLEYIRPLYCRTCGACSGKCPKGLPVSDMLRILSYADGYGQFPLARERFQELPEEVAHVRCRECSTCAIQCPNGVRVAERLIRAQELLA